VNFRLLWLCLAAAACSGAPARPRPAPAPKLDAQARKQVSQEYYEAVDAYMKEDYALARALIGSILAVEPANPDALALRRRIQAVEKLSSPR
jgi:hypothetical protein